MSSLLIRQQAAAGSRARTVRAADISRLVVARFEHQLAGRQMPSARRTDVPIPELVALSLVYESTHCDSTEAAIEGFRLGWECGSLGLPFIALTNRPWSRRIIDRDWCVLHNVGMDAIERVVDVCGAYPGSGVAVRFAFELGHEASSSLSSSTAKE